MGRLDETEEEITVKKWICALILMLAVMTSFALADGAKVTFAEKSGQVNGGFDYTITLNIAPAQSEEMTLQLLCDGLDGSYSVIVPAGEKKVSLTIPTQVVEEKTKVVFEVAAAEGYTTSGKHTLTVLRLPTVKFYLGINFGTVDKKMTVRVMNSNSANIIKSNNNFQLRDSDGTVLAEKTWSNPGSDMNFVLTPTADMEGYHEMSVWLGDYKVADGGYLTVMDGSRRIIKQVDTDKKYVAIGIDCGFGGKNMDKVLEVLEKHNTKVTFFMTGYFVRNFTEESKRALAAGHEIGDHTNTHPKLTDERPYDMMREIVFTAETMQETLGVTPRLMRPPYGDTNSNVLSVSRSEGMEGIMWSMDTKDSLGKYTTEQCIKYGTTLAKLEPGKILLTHLDSSHSWEIVDACLTYYEEQGYTVMPISALIYATGGSLPEMPFNRESLIYSDEYWLNWLAENNIEMDSRE